VRVRHETFNGKPRKAIRHPYAGGRWLLSFHGHREVQLPTAPALAALGGSDSALAWTTIYGLAGGIVGILLFTSEPSVFLKLSRTGLIIFVILMALLPILCWIPWVVPGLREKPGQPTG
jgi:hypothetical protein